MRSRGFTTGVALVCFVAVLSCRHFDGAPPAASDSSKSERLPNVIVILADDMGYGDTSYAQHPSIRTPNLDAMAREGQAWTHFYVASSVCSPSRAALLTGRLPIRSGIASSKRRVFFPDSKGGLPQTELTLAELFKARGYATASIGKWHLGHQAEFLPIRHGFDEYFGIPYSNDMDKTPEARAALRIPGEGEAPAPGWFEPRSEWFQVPLMRADVIVERAPDQRSLTRRYTDASLDFIRRHDDHPFFLYLAFSMPHVPLFRSPEFSGKSRAGLYGDVIEEMDFAIGRILDGLRERGLEEDTLVVFTSDNGPWREFAELGGSAGPLRGGKSTAWEGGFRVPAVFWSPGRIAPGPVDAIGSTLDLLPTLASLIGAARPERQLDGVDLLPVLKGRADGPRGEMFFYLGEELAALRVGRYKVHFKVKQVYGRQAEPLDRPLLFDLEMDPAERVDIAPMRPEVVAALTRRADAHRAGIVPVENQLLRR